MLYGYEKYRNRLPDKAESFKQFRKKYKNQIAVCEEMVSKKEGIYGATLWSGSSGLPWLLSFDLNEVLEYLYEYSKTNAYPDLSRVEFINFGEHPEQEIVGYLFVSSGRCIGTCYEMEDNAE